MVSYNKRYWCKRLKQKNLAGKLDAIILYKRIEVYGFHKVCICISHSNTFSGINDVFY
jgi:hypothetical protein